MPRPLAWVQSGWIQPAAPGLTKAEERECMCDYVIFVLTTCLQDLDSKFFFIVSFVNLHTYVVFDTSFTVLYTSKYVSFNNYKLLSIYCLFNWLYWVIVLWTSVCALHTFYLHKNYFNFQEWLCQIVRSLNARTFTFNTQAALAYIWEDMMYLFRLSYYLYNFNY